MTLLLRHRIKTLMLDAGRAFPSEAQDAKDKIRRWRHEQRLWLARRRNDDPDAGDSVHPVRAVLGSSKP